MLFITRFPPLNGTSGAGTYHFSFLRYLHSRGIAIHVCWSEGPRSAERGWYVVPKEFAQIATLHFPSSIEIGRLRLFPGLVFSPLKARLLRGIKQSLFALGLEPLFRKFRPSALEAESTSPEGDPATESVAAADPYAWDRPPEPFERAFFGQAIARFHPDAVIFNFCWLTPITQEMAAPDQCLKITLANDLRHIYSTLVEGRIRQSEGEYMSKESEINYLLPSDIIAAIREDDGEVFRRECPGSKMVVVHPSFAPSPSRRSPCPDRCLFVASDSLANREGLLWFLEHAWPLIRTTRPAAELHVCGPICKALTLNQPGVVARGFVDSLQAVYDEASVVIVPLLRGSGVKIKLMEALAHGKACVTTPIGVEGMPLLEPGVCIAPTPGEFAAQVLRLLGDEALRKDYEGRALTILTEKFSPAACYGPLYDEIVNFHAPA